MGAQGARRRWQSAAAAVIVMTALMIGRPGRADGTNAALVVSILTPEPGEVCVAAKLGVEVQVGYLPKDSGGALAPLVAPSPVRISLTATASRGKVTPPTQSIGPFTAYGQRRTVVLGYRASAPGHEDLTVTGSLAGGGSWKATMSFEVVRCKLVVVGTADMSPATNPANEAAGGMWTIGASLDLDGAVLPDESGATGTGTGTVAFSITGDWTSDVDVFACALDPPWTGTGTVGLRLDAALPDDGALDVTVDVGAIDVNATTVTCGGVGGIGVSMAIPAWQVPAATLDLDPVANPGGTDVQDFPYDAYELPMTVSVVERAA